MSKDYHYVNHTKWSPTCEYCAFYQNAREVSQEFPQEIELAYLDGRTMICGNFYSSNFLEEIDSDCTCESFVETDT